jgi:hypothetical protein
MRKTGRGLSGAALVVALVLAAKVAVAEPYEQRPAYQRAFFTGMAVIANVVPIVSAFYAPKCLPGYILCKLTFAGFSAVAAADQFWFSGDADPAQTRAILQRGFSGDWYLTGRHTAGDVEPQPLPEAPPPAPDSGGWQPPPL